MTGHSHTYSWTFPLTGQVDGTATYEDHGEPDHFLAGVGLPQLVSGVGGVGLRTGDFGAFPFVAAGFSSSTPVAARLGFSKIDVTPDMLTVSYVAADTGGIIDSFRIEKEAVQTVSFRQGVGGYAGTIDTMLREHDPATSQAAAVSLKVDADNPSASGRDVQVLLRFADLFGSGAGRIPANAELRSAMLRLRVTNGGDEMRLHRMMADWSPSATWASSGGGIQADGVEAAAFADTATGRVGDGVLSFNVLASLRAWQAAPATNRGWAVLPTGGDGIDFDSAEGTAPPELVVTYVVSAADPAGPPAFVVADTAVGSSFHYGVAGEAIGHGGYAVANDRPRGVAASPDGSRQWVLNADGLVFVYDAGLRLQGTWRAEGLVDPTGIAVAGTTVFVCDQGTRRIHVYEAAVARLAGRQAATRVIALRGGNANPQDIATDGRTAWVVNAAATDKVFVYRVSSGRLLGSWRLDGGNASPTGITIDPTGGRASLWVVDDVADRVFEYRNGRSLRSGSRRAASSFALAVGNGSPQGIAAPAVLTALAFASTITD
jgi:DNA-binding beta-propeller fold protein YncE